jgi:hypothetical protein
MEYADLLEVAADRIDSTERMIYVAAFAASEYASTIGRVAKPFNLFFSFLSALHCCKSICPSKCENHLEAEKPIAHFHLSAHDSHLHILAFRWAQLSMCRVIAPNSLN